MQVMTLPKSIIQVMTIDMWEWCSEVRYVCVWCGGKVDVVYIEIIFQFA